MSFRPRTVVHRGHVEAAAFLLRFNTVSSAEARRRILSMWERQGKVYRLDDGLLYVLPRPVAIDTSESPGLPLIRRERKLIGAPVPATECGERTLAETLGGVLTTRSIDTLREEDPSVWISIAGMQFENGQSLGEEIPRPIPVIERRSVDIRETLKAIPGISDETQGLLCRLAGKQASVGMNGRAQPLSRLSRLLTSGTNRSRSTQPQEPSPLSVLFNRVFGRMLMATRLSLVLGRRNSRHLSDMMRMFESGDVEEALRHAIPLRAVSDSPALMTAFGWFARRSSLQLQPWARPGAASIPLAEGLLEELKRLYESTFKRLEAQGRIDEAAFVLAELLRQDAQAVAFLEKHGKLREAAELAEGRELAPEIVIRQWYVAGDRERAMLLARKTGSFPTVVSLLDRNNDPRALEFRKLWAQALADAGNPAAAVDVLWPIEAERAEMSGWMQSAVELGGEGAARSLARMFLLRPEAFEWCRERALSLLESDSPNDVLLQREFQESLRHLPRTPETRTIARAAIRTGVRNAGRGYRQPGNGFRRLVDYAEDSGLRADIPPQAAAAQKELKDTTEVRRHRVTALDRGLDGIFDAAPLPSGGYLLALGEIGMKVVNREGRSVSRFSHPAHQLVLSDKGSRAIALAVRGRAWMLAKVDLQQRKAEAWCLAELNGFLDSFDGDRWYVIEGQDLYVLDAMSNRFDALWRIPDLGQHCGPLLLVPGRHLSLVTFDRGQWWLWRYRVPGLQRLVEKSPLSGIPDADEPGQPVALMPCGIGGLLALLNDRAFYSENGTDWSVFASSTLDETGIGSAIPGDQWTVLVFRGAERSRVALYSLHANSPPALRLEVLIEGKSPARVRLGASSLTIVSAGRVQTYSLVSGDLIGQYRSD